MCVANIVRNGISFSIQRKRRICALGRDQLLLSYLKSTVLLFHGWKHGTTSASLWKVETNFHAAWKRNWPLFTELWTELYGSRADHMNFSCFVFYEKALHWYKVHGWLISPTKEDFCEKKDSERVPKKRQRRRHGTFNWFIRSTLSRKNQDTIHMNCVQ